MTEREPDIGQDARDIETGEGYPEEEAGEVQADSHGDGPRKHTGGTDAPSSEGPEDEGPEGATGNPGAAGG